LLGDISSNHSIRLYQNEGSIGVLFDYIVGNTMPRSLASRALVVHGEIASVAETIIAEKERLTNQFSVLAPLYVVKQKYVFGFWVYTGASVLVFTRATQSRPLARVCLCIAPPVFGFRSPSF
jgi:hypothetical protein